MSIQQMCQTTAAIDGLRGQRLAIVAGGNVYTSSNLANPNIAGSGVFSSGAAVQMCEVSGPALVYMVAASSSIKQVNARTNTMITYAATEGTAPEGATICCIYRGRLVLAGVSEEEQNFFASRAGTRTDWDYAQKDELAAFAGNDRVNDIITALCPFVDDYLIFGCDHSIYRMTGDIAAGGTIDRISEKIGMLGPDAWTTDATGNIYFVGPGGFYRMTPQGGIEDLSSSVMSRFFRNLDRGSYIVQVRWDQPNKGCWIFATARSDNTTTHLWWDARTGGFFPMQFPHTAGPTSSVVYDGDDPTDSALLLGGRDGIIRQLDESALADDGTAITSFAYLPHQKPAGDQLEARLNAVEFILGELPSDWTVEEDWNLDWTIQAGKGPYDAYAAPDETETGNYTTPGRQEPEGLRMTANTFFVKLSNSTLDKIWSIDHVSAEFYAAGRER